MFRCVVALACAFSVTPVLAWSEYHTKTVTESREVHDSWRMTCYPQDGIPFNVVYWGYERNLAIISSRGLQRNKRILSNPDDGLGFTVEADGFDVHGDPRHLRAHFDRDGSYLEITDRDDPPIQCGPMQASSND